MNISIDDLEPGNPGQATPTDMAQVIVKVREAGYVPPTVTLRARIDEYLFTADVPVDKFPELEHNPQVVSMAATEKLRIIE
ncbi:MAG: hypothetical protein FJX77_08560 [Armatimonadetes bacterium]|nr:hypothetical protein [Armatimonadota bacterium]